MGHSLQGCDCPLAVACHPHPVATGSTGDLNWFQDHVPLKLGDEPVCVPCCYFPPRVSWDPFLCTGTGRTLKPKLMTSLNKKP